jgi:hypothetical protein
VILRLPRRRPRCKTEALLRVADALRSVSVHVASLHVDSSRPECANSGHSPTAWRMAQYDPLLTFKVGPLNGREAPESGLRRTRRLRQCVVLWRRQSAKPPRLQPPRDVAAFLRTEAVSLSVVVSGERLSQAANCLQLLVFDHCHASGPRVSRVANPCPRKHLAWMAWHSDHNSRSASRRKASGTEHGGFKASEA